MGLRELIASVRELASAHGVAVITSFLIAFVAIYSLAPIEWQEFFIRKSPSFLPFGITLFDVLVTSVSLVFGLICHGLIRLYSLLKNKISKWSPKQIARILENELQDIDRGVLLSIVFNHPIDEERPDIMASKHKLKELRLIEAWYGALIADPQVKSYIYEQARLGNIEVEKLFPDRYRSHY